MSIFSPSDALCGIFAPGGCAGDTHRLVTVMRAAHLVTSATPVQNASGEVALSFIAVGSIPVDWHPKPAGIGRLLQGIVVEIAAVAFAGPGVNIRALDRCTVDGQRLECVTVLRWGEHTECEFKALGR
jgi:hypothetical protein